MCLQVRTTLADLQFLFCDLFVVTLLAIVMGRGGPSGELHPHRPSASLLALPVLGSLLLHTGMVVLGQLAALFITTSQDWSVERRAATESSAFCDYICDAETRHRASMHNCFCPPGTFHSIQRCSAWPICPTWRTPACFPCQLSSTSSWPWWSPRGTLTRNLSSTTVSHHRCPGILTKLVDRLY